MLICHLFNFSDGDLSQALLHKQELKVKDSNSTPLRRMEDIQQCA